MYWFAVNSAGVTRLEPSIAICAAVSAAACLLLALWIDRRWGEPASAWHPVVWMGCYLGFCGRISTRYMRATAFAAGATTWLAGVGLVGVLAWGVQALALQQAVLLAGRPDPLRGIVSLLLLAVLSWFLKTMFSWRMLLGETLAVETALQRSLEAGRERLAMLVSRDTSNLDESEVRESAIESLAENLNDSMVAPIFWFVLFGLPGAAIYRFANTADAMWGYRGFRHGVEWEWAGKWAAWADDVLSWLPARVTAMLLLPAAWSFPRFKVLLAETRKTPSPNSGWPMAAMALALGVRLRKPGAYALNAEGRSPVAADIFSATDLASRALSVFTACTLALLLCAAAFSFLL